MATLDRTGLTNMVVELQSDEALGILDTSYVEDYNGVDGQVTIYHVADTTSWPIVMSLFPIDLLKGQIALAGLPDGNYEVRGRVQDVYGNYTIITSFAAPNGTEDVLIILFTIQSGAIVGWITANIRSYPRISANIRAYPCISANIRAYPGNN